MDSDSDLEVNYRGDNMQDERQNDSTSHSEEENNRMKNQKSKKARKRKSSDSDEDASDVDKWLKNSKLEMLIPKFKKENMTMESLKFLNEDDLAALVPSIGIRSILRGSLLQFNLNNIHQTQTDVLPYTPTRHNSPGTSYSGVLSTSSGSSCSSLASNSSFVKEFSKESVIVKKIILSEIIGKSSKGQYVTLSYEKNKKLDHLSRRYLIDAISEHYFDLGETIRYKEMEIISEQIEELFPTEKKETYFCPGTVKNRARGKLLNRVSNASRSRRASGQLENLKKRKMLDPVEEEEDINDDDLKTMNDNQVYCNNNFTDWTVLRSKWTNSFKLRKQITPTPGSWLCLKQTLGYSLIDIDFKLRFPSEEDMDVALIKSFDILHSKIGPNLDKIKDAKCRLLKLEYLEDKQTKDSKDLTLVLLLCAILMNKQYITTSNKEKYKPSIAEIQNSLILFVNAAPDVKSKLKSEWAEKKSKGHNFQPIIVVVGQPTPKSFIVHYDGILYTFKTFLQALDICFKLHYALQLEYATESRYVWEFLQFFSYNIKSGSFGPDVMALVSSI